MRSFENIRNSITGFEETSRGRRFLLIEMGSDEICTSSSISDFYLILEKYL